MARVSQILQAPKSGRVAQAVARQGSHRPGRARTSASGSSARTHQLRGRTLLRAQNKPLWVTKLPLHKLRSVTSTDVLKRAEVASATAVISGCR